MTVRACTTPRRQGASAESGFSLVEVIVSMVLLAIVALSFLPLVARAVTGSATSSTRATAVRLVSEQMELVRSTGGGCSAYVGADRGGEVVTSVRDPRGVLLDVRSDMGPCVPGAAFPFTVWVTRAATPSVRLAEVVTLIAADPQ
jgi:prepilin-type N-terminal cleavage/methylation domain-containing protein